MVKKNASDRKVAIVTGGGTGIGKHSALALLNDGYSVVVTGRRMEPLRGTIRESGEPEGRILAVQTDVGSPMSVEALFVKTIESFGRLDVLFNNAGGGAPAVPIEDLTFEQWQSVLASNLTGSFLCTQQAVRIMKSQDPQGGRIINNGSISATTPRPNSAPYTTTKHGIAGLTKSTALDGRTHNIACSQIDIGNAGTDMTERMKDGVAQPDGSVKMEPTFDVNHVAQAVLYIANLPLDTNVLFMTIMATKMPFVGRG